MAIVYLLSVTQGNGTESDVWRGIYVHGSYNSAAMNAVRIIAEWTEGDFSPYDTNSTLKFRSAIVRKDFAEAFSIWNRHMSGSCNFSITEDEVDDNGFTSQKVADEAMTLLFGDDEYMEDNG